MEGSMIRINPPLCWPQFPLRVTYSDTQAVEEYADASELAQAVEDLDTTDPDFNDVSVSASDGRPVRIILHLGELVVLQLDPGASVSVVRYCSSRTSEGEVLVESSADYALRAIVWREVRSRRLFGRNSIQRRAVSYPQEWDSEYSLKPPGSDKEPVALTRFEELWWANRK